MGTRGWAIWGMDKRHNPLQLALKNGSESRGHGPDMRGLHGKTPVHRDVTLLPGLQPSSVDRVLHTYGIYILELHPPPPAWQSETEPARQSAGMSGQAQPGSNP